MSKLLEDILVIDFSQFLSGPSATLRLADMGARVIKVEKEGSGDICRMLYVSDVKMEDNESTVFHAINRNKDSYCANLKEPASLEAIKTLVAKADILVHNFRPGVMKRLGLDYEKVKMINPALVYGEISGYGQEGEWKDLPGQDLLLQAISGITFLTETDNDFPTPIGIGVADIVTGIHMVQGVLAALFQSIDSGIGSLVQVSMIESILDFQFEKLTGFLNKDDSFFSQSLVDYPFDKSVVPYGIYRTKSGYIAISSGTLKEFSEVLNEPALLDFYGEAGLGRRKDVKLIFKQLLLDRTTACWLNILRAQGINCSDVYDYNELLANEAVKQLKIDQFVRSGHRDIRATRCPVRVDGTLLLYDKGAPQLGEHNAAIDNEFNLK